MWHGRVWLADSRLHVAALQIVDCGFGITDYESAVTAGPPVLTEIENIYRSYFAFEFKKYVKRVCISRSRFLK